MAEAEAPGGDAQSCTGPALYGLLRLGRLPVAMPAGLIREVVPCPDELAPFPALMPYIAGAIELRGPVIPVLDLGRMLGARVDGAAMPGRIVAVVRYADRVLGVLANGMDDVQPLDEQAIGALEVAGGAGHAGHRGIVRATFVHGGLSGVILDPEALVACPGLPTLEDWASRPKARHQRGIALNSPNGNVSGLLARRGRTVPVVDFGKQVGLGAEPRRAITIIVRRHDADGVHRIGFSVDALRSVQRAVPQTLQVRSPEGRDAARPFADLDLTIRLDNGKACSVMDLSALSRHALAAGGPV